MNDRAVFTTEAGIIVPAVSGEGMRELDRIATEEFGLSLLQMMENAGRSLADLAADMPASSQAHIAVLAGAGGNGGGGLCAAPPSQPRVCGHYYSGPAQVVVPALSMPRRHFKSGRLAQGAGSDKSSHLQPLGNADPA